MRAATLSCQFTASGGNKYFPLVPGRQLYCNNSRCVSQGDCDELEELWITTEFQTRRVTLGTGAHRRQLTARAVEERETEDGEIVSHDGAWIAGRHGAMPGIITPDSAFMPGTRYFQERAPDVTLDRAEHVGGGLQIDVPAGTFNGCIEARETSPLEPGSEST